MIVYSLFCALLGLTLALLLTALDKMNRARPLTAGEEVAFGCIENSHTLESSDANCQVPDGDLERSDKDFEVALAAIRELQHARLVMCKPGQ